MVECDWVVAKVWLIQTCNFTFCKFGAEWKWAGSSVFEAEWNKRYAKVKVVSVHTVCSFGEPVDWFLSAVRSYWDLDRLNVKEEVCPKRWTICNTTGELDTNIGKLQKSLFSSQERLCGSYQGDLQREIWDLHWEGHQGVELERDGGGEDVWGLC